VLAVALVAECGAAAQRVEEAATEPGYAEAPTTEAGSLTADERCSEPPQTATPLCIHSTMYTSLCPYTYAFLSPPFASAMLLPRRYVTIPTCSSVLVASQSADAASLEPPPCAGAYYIFMYV
jgi:hypothetical protein